MFQLLAWHLLWITPRVGTEKPTLDSEPYVVHEVISHNRYPQEYCRHIPLSASFLSILAIQGESDFQSLELDVFFTLSRLVGKSEPLHVVWLTRNLLTSVRSSHRSRCLPFNLAAMLGYCSSLLWPVPAVSLTLSRVERQA